jgi:hypothetical protein
MNKWIITWPQTTSPLQPLSDGWKKTWVNKPATAATEPALYIPQSSSRATLAESSLEWLKPGLDVLYLACASSGTLLASIFHLISVLALPVLLSSYWSWFSPWQAYPSQKNCISHTMVEFQRTVIDFSQGRSLGLYKRSAKARSWYWYCQCIQCCLISQSLSLSICIYNILVYSPACPQLLQLCSTAIHLAYKYSVALSCF